MKKEFIRLLFLGLALLGLGLLTGCSHTYDGMKQDLREDTNSDYDTPG
jgi:hypothetical protein